MLYVGLVWWDFKVMLPTFQRQAADITSQGLPTHKATFLIESKAKKAHKQAVTLASLHIMEKQGELDTTHLEEEQQKELEHLLQKYQDLFDVPKGFPPRRELNRPIPLKERTTSNR